MRLRFYIPPVWTDHSNEHPHDPVPTRRRILDLKHFETLPPQKQIVSVAGTGFFLDGYLLFANDFALPIVGSLYWSKDTRSDHETGINIATLGGAICGQLGLGFLADKLGRKKVYGWELFIVVVASVGVAMASEGMKSMRITPWLVFFRFLTGVGVGAEYPITAVITSEFAPTSHRGRMLATVFCLQSLGQFSSALVAFAAVRGGLALDSAWRLVYGVAAFPAALALLLRLSIPESPRYTFDVARNADLANFDLDFIAGTDSQRGDERNGQAHQGPQAGFPPKASWEDAKDYFIRRGNWRHLLATAGAWMLLDLSFYGLGLSSPQIVAGIYNGCWGSQVPLSESYIWDSEPAKANSIPTRDILQDNEIDFMIIVSVGAVIGSALLIWLANHLNRKLLQLAGFLALALLFFILGSVLVTVGNFGVGNYGPKYAVIVFYALAQAIFNLGPNGLTFMFPAEIFPTRYRCSCHGISAAAGKFGSVIAVIALRNIQFHALAICQDGPKALGKVLLGFAVAMLLGAVFAWFVPEVQYRRNRRNIPLEILALGRQSAGTEGTVLENIASGTGQRMGDHPRPQTSSFVDPSTDPPADSSSLRQEASL